LRRDTGAPQRAERERAMESSHGAVAHDHGAPGRRGRGGEGTEPGEAAHPDPDPRACPASRVTDHEIGGHFGTLSHLDRWRKATAGCRKQHDRGDTTLY